MKYQVEISADISETFEIEADNKEDAQDFALAQFNPVSESASKIAFTSDYKIRDIYAKPVED